MFKNFDAQKFLVRVPLLGPLFLFDLSQHKQAFFKGFFLWIFSFLPIILAAGMTNTPDGGGNLLLHLLESLKVKFNDQSQFVYAATFIPPFLYIIVEKIKDEEGSLKEKLTESVKDIFKGYKLLWIISLFSLFLLAGTFGANLNNLSEFKNTILYNIISTYSLYFYLGAMYVWYLAILENTMPSRNFLDRSQSGERKLRDQLANRLSDKG